MTKFIALDVETTGLNPRTHRIVEIALVEVTSLINARASGSVELSVYETLVNPERTISRDATKVHGITNADVADAPVFTDITGHILDKLAGDNVVVIGHNVAFDIKFLRAEFDRAGVRLPMIETECSLWLARRVLPQAENHKLGTLASILDLAGTGGKEHSAAHDAVLSAQLFHTLTRMEEMEQEVKPRKKASPVATKSINVSSVEAKAQTRKPFHKILRNVAITAISMVAWFIAITVTMLVTISLDPTASFGLVFALFSVVSVATVVVWWKFVNK